jgi:uncharacterized membrane protein YecN with MAPEG domain
MALLLVPLSVQVSLRRAKMRTVFGDAGDETLRRRIRAHGNFVEYAPLALIALGLMEYGGAASRLVSILGAALRGGARLTRACRRRAWRSA